MYIDKVRWLCYNYKKEEVAMPAYLKGKHIVSHQKELYLDANKGKRPRVTQYTYKRTYVPLLEDRLTDSEKNALRYQNISIKDFRFTTSPDLTIANFSKLGSKQQYNFILSDEVLEEVLKTPKIILRENNYASEGKDGSIYKIKRLYLLAPWLENKDLPCVYSLNIQCSGDEKTYAISLQAIVGGCRDGAVNLMRIDSPHEYYDRYDEYYIPDVHIHKAVAGKVNKKFEFMPRTAVKDCNSMKDALQIIMNECGVKYYSFGMTDKKIFDLIKIYSADTAHKIATPITEEIKNQLVDFTGVRQRNDLRELVRENDTGSIKIEGIFEA